jgi:HEAT repeat protein
MKLNHLSRLAIACLLAITAIGARADEEQNQIATLQSAASAPDKCAACQRLRMIGTAKSVPALAALLGEERISQAARYALEEMPVPEAGAALRQALLTTSGPLQSGVADSVGWRRDTAGVPLLKPLLRGADALVASAAATALGRIGDKEATAALISARNKVSPAVQPAVLNGLLQSAEQRLAAGDAKEAASLYGKLFTTKYPDRIRVAAWRGVVLADAKHRPKMVSQALLGKDRSLQMAAMKAVRELGDAPTIEACLQQWTKLPAGSQLAVLDARLKLGGEVLPAVHLAMQSQYVSVRSAAWMALSDLGDASALPALARAAARGEPAERDAAREALVRVRGARVREALLKQIAAAEPVEKAELLRALGERGDTEAAGVLLENAAAASGPARSAALESLRKLAAPGTLVPLLEIAAKSGSEADCELGLNALYAICKASPDKDQMTRSALEAMRQMPAREHRQVLAVLAELGTPAALEATQAATREPDPEMVKEAVRVLGQWPNSAPASLLLEMARTSSPPSLRVLALRGCIEVAGQEPDMTKRLQMLQQARSAATRPEEKKQVLAKIGQIPTAAALHVAVADLADADLVNEAGQAAITVAEQVAATNAPLAGEAAAKVLEHCQVPEITKRAIIIRVKFAGPGPFIRDWLLSGPYTQPGANSLSTLFKAALGPETPGKKVKWTAITPADHINLAALFPGRENCVAYLKTQITAPEERDAFLLLGSDDGVKAWLNGVLVHANDINRGDVPDQDVAPIRLRQGTNELMLKITQGGGGWSAHARIIGSDLKPIAGLRVQTPPGAAPSAPVPAAQPGS